MADDGAVIGRCADCGHLMVEHSESPLRYCLSPLCACERFRLDTRSSGGVGALVSVTQVCVPIAGDDARDWADPQRPVVDEGALWDELVAQVADDCMRRGLEPLGDAHLQRELLSDPERCLVLTLLQPLVDPDPPRYGRPDPQED